MTIVFYYKSFNLGGVQTLIARLARWYSEHGDYCFVFTDKILRDEEAVRKLFEIENVELVVKKMFHVLI